MLVATEVGMAEITKYNLLILKTFAADASFVRPIGKSRRLAGIEFCIAPKIPLSSKREYCNTKLMVDTRRGVKNDRHYLHNAKASVQCIIIPLRRDYQIRPVRFKAYPTSSCMISTLILV
jgi:hypothetical protein